jgi:peptidoglycan/xylan/chitin deacetylase (PgdA/CDA1 family)
MPRGQLASFCSDPLHLPRPVEPLTWDDATTLAGEHEIGSHTRSHRDLTSLARDALADELQGSKHDLEARLGREVRHFSAPYGDVARFSADVSRAARDAGYESCATAQRGVNVPGADVYALRRDHLVAGWPLRDVRYFLSR